MADLIQTEFVKPLESFFQDSKMFLYKCDKPTLEEFTKVGFLGFMVKLVFIPVNNVIIGQ